MNIMPHMFQRQYTLGMLETSASRYLCSYYIVLEEVYSISRGQDNNDVYICEKITEHNIAKVWLMMSEFKKK